MVEIGHLYALATHKVEIRFYTMRVLLTVKLDTYILSRTISEKCYYRPYTKFLSFTNNNQYKVLSIELKNRISVL